MPKEIFYCNLTVLHDKKEIILKEVIYKETDGLYRKGKYKDIPAQVLKVQVIKSLGFDCEQIGHTEVTKSEEHRNIITGAYD